jgi:tetratricopeptide (TPR) repeat protein
MQVGQFIDRSWKLKPSWSEAKLASCREEARRGDSFKGAYASCKLACIEGDYERADSLLTDLLAEQSSRGLGGIVNTFCCAVIAGDGRVAGQILADSLGSGWKAEIALVPGVRADPNLVRWSIRSDRTMLFEIDIGVFESDNTEFYLERLAAMRPLFAAYCSTELVQYGELIINLGDEGHVPGLSFCSRSDACFLIPDPAFLVSAGYSWLRGELVRRPTPWGQRKPVALWRGTTTGQREPGNGPWHSLPRVQLCRLALGSGRGLLDCGLTNAVQLVSRSEEIEIKQSGLMRDFVKPERFQDYIYNIDIDGNTNSWPGLFQKLLSGSPVLKVESSRGFRQWYYNRLRPWWNYIPVKSDMSDLLERIEWLRANDEAAKRIGERGRALADSMTIEAESEKAVETIAAAVLASSASRKHLVETWPSGGHSKLVNSVTFQDPEKLHGDRLLRGRTLAAAGEASEAIAAFREAVRCDPGNEEAHDALGRMLAEVGQLEEGIAELREAVALKPDVWEHHHHLAKALEKAGRLEEAEAEIRQVLELRSDNGDLRGYHGHVLARLGRIEDAIRAFEQALALLPDNAGLHGALSHAYNRLGQTGDAVSAIRKAIELRRPESAPDYAHLGNLLRLQDDYLGAITAYEKAAALAPDNQEYAKQLGALRATPIARTDAEREAQKAQVAVGKDGWLFHNVDTAFEQVCQGKGLSERNHSRLLSLWEARHGWCTQRGIDYRILIVPERHVLYPDKLPEGYAPSEERPAVRMLRSMDRFVRPAVIYPDEAIRGGRTTREVCYKTDVHWTRWGAYLGYRELMKTLPRCAGQIVQEQDLRVSEHTLTGGLTLWLDRRDRETAIWMEPPPVGEKEVFTTRTFKPGQVDIYETPRRDLPRLVLFRTSNSTHLLPFLFGHFSRIVAVGERGSAFRAAAIGAAGCGDFRDFRAVYRAEYRKPVVD